MGIQGNKGALSYATQLLSTSQPIRAPRWRLALGVLRDRNSKVAETPQVGDLPVDIGDVVCGEKFRLVVTLVPLVGDLFEFLVVFGDFLFELLAKAFVVAKLALQ